MEKTFWIQGRTGRYWQNLESLESDKAVIVRLGALIGEDRYDELRLIQAQVSQITGETVFKTIVTIKDGQVVDSALSQAQGVLNASFAPSGQGAATPHPAQDFTDRHNSEQPELANTPGDPDAMAEDPHAENHPQLRFWPTPKPENLQGQLSLDGETNWIQDTQAAIAEDEGVHPASRSGADGRAKTTDEVVEELVSEWKLPNSPQQDPSDPYFQDLSPKARRKLTADPDSREGGASRRARRSNADRRGQGKTRRSKDRAKKRSTTAGRAALMSGVFAGALATGLAISAISPDFAGRFFAGISGQIGDVLPNKNVIDAIADGDLQSLRARLAEGVDPNTLDAAGNPALLLAAQTGNLAAVSLLLQAGANPAQPTADGISVLHTMAAEGRSQAMARMLDAGAPIDLAGGQYGCLTPLSIAAASGRMRVASLLAERGAALDARSDCAAGPMEIAAAHPHVFARLEQIRAERDSALAQTTRNAIGAPMPQSGAQNTPSQRITTLPESTLERDGITEEPLPPTNAELLLGGEGRGQERAPGNAAASLAGAAGDLETAGERGSLQDQVAAALPQSGEEAVFIPPPKPEPPAAAAADPRVFSTRLRTAIDSGDQGTVVALLGDKPTGFSLDDARYAVEDSFGSGVRTALEQAALSGRGDIVRLLAGDGATISPGIVHQIVQHSDRANMADVLSALLEQGANPNSMLDGISPLMRASLRGDPQTAYMLMAFGADPSTISADGRLASDFARDAGRADLEERLVLAAREPEYSNLMMGLSWTDTLSTMRSRIEVCKDLGDDFTACKLNIPTWMEDAKSVIAQFDRKASDRLVAIQIDSHPISTVPSAVARFDAARREIQARIPAGHGGFVTTELQDSETLFRDLRPEVSRARYFSYWPDEDRRRPVFVHLKLNGLSDDQGFYRIVIGNPFRAS